MIKRAPLGCMVVMFFLSLGMTVMAQLPERTPKTVPAQPAEPAGQGQTCPPIAVQPQPFGTVRDGQKIYFTANYPTGGGEPKPGLTIVWNTSAGTILQGQGTTRIEVDTASAGNTPDREVKAEIWVSGFAPDCVMQASAAVKIIAPATKFGEFGEVSAEKFSSNIKSLAEYLTQTQTQDAVYAIVYAGRSSERGFAQNWVKKIKTELSAAGIVDSRVYALDGGFREQPLFDFWIVPIGADPPRPEPTVKRTEIVYPKTTPTKKP